MNDAEFAREQVENLDAAMQMIATVASAMSERPGFEGFFLSTSGVMVALEDIKWGLDNVIRIDTFLREKGK